MVVRTKAAPSTLWSKSLAEPKIDESARVHSFANLIGDVKVNANVLIAPGTSIRADEGLPFYIGEDTKIQDGTIVHGLKKGQVVGDDGEEYSVWIGKETCITHMALIHGPAYIGDRCFIGFRSTVFNARVGEGCIVMMHALIQDVEISPGKYVPSGAVIVNQQQADRLPNVQESDRALVNCINEVSHSGDRSVEKAARPTSPTKRQTKRSTKNPKETTYKKSVESMSLDSDIREQVRSLLSQGYAISAEHADKRRYKTSSWLTCGTISGKREDQVLQELQGYLNEYEGEYVRLIGIDTKAKRRVVETVIQRPGETSSLNPGAAKPASYKSASNASAKSSEGWSSNGLSRDLVSQVRSLLNQGYKVGTEYADKRRYKTSSWLTGTTIDARRETEAIRTLEAELAEHQNEYVRLVGIDPNAKRRILEVIIQRPGETAAVSSNGSAHYSSGTKTKTSANSGRSGLSGEVIAQIRSLLSQGYKIGSEHADKRRFKTSSWQSCTPIESSRDTDVIASLEACLAEHQGEYVRLLGIDTKAKRRVLETIVQRPEDTPQTNSRPAKAASSTSYSSSSNGYSTKASSNNLDSDTISQIRSLLSQGYKIGSEHADKRRFKTGSWQSCAPIESNRETDVITALEACLAEHEGEYVRLLGIDTKAKRRVLETVIQRP